MSSSRNTIAVGLYFVFGIPFFLAGLGMMGVGAYQIVGPEQPDWGAGAFLALFGAVFAAVGLLVMTRGRRGVRKAREHRERLEAKKDTPWRLREDWARGVVRCSTRSAVVGLWAFAVVWNLLSSPLLFALREEVMEKENYLILIGLLFPVIGVILVFLAIRQTLRYLKFGVSELHLRALPARPGGFLAGVVRLNARLEPSDGYHVKLTCLRRTVSGSGKNRTTREKVLWQEQHVVDRPLSGDLMATEIPISLALPAGASETTLDNPQDRVLWLLEVSADVFGVDYAASFEVPVFQTDRVETLAPDHIEGADWAAQYRRPHDVRPPSAWAAESESGVQIERRAHGVKEFYFPPGRNIGAATGLTCFTAVWTGFIWLMLELGAPFLFPVVFGLFDLLLVLACVSMWFGSTRTLIDGREITIRSRILGVGPTRKIPVEDIQEIRLDIGMQSGRTPYYDPVVQYRGDKKASLGSSIRDKREAERILEEMKGCLPALQPEPAAQEAVLT